MEGEVAAEAWIYYWEMLASVSLVSRIDGFHAHIETQDEIVEIHTESQAIAYGYLFPELVDLELSSGLVLIVSQCPDVSRIDKQSPVHFPKEMCPILYV